MASQLHIAIKPETLFHLGGLEISNTLFTSFVVTLFTILFAVWANRQLKSTGKPSRSQALVEMIVESVYGIVHSVAGKRAWTFMPLIFGYFIFIAFNNWAEQIPGFHTIQYTGEPGIHLTQVPSWMQVPTAFAHNGEEHPQIAANVEALAAETSEVGHDADIVSEGESHSESATPEGDHGATEEHHSVALLRGANADINMTLALALISVGATQYFGLKFAHLGYLKKFFNFSSPISFFIGILELLGEFSRIMSFSFRLFGNIFAGEVLIAVISFLVPVIVPTPFMAFELFVGILQAYVFAMISTVTFSMAAEGHHE